LRGERLFVAAAVWLGPCIRPVFCSQFAVDDVSHPMMVCAFSVLELGRSVVRHVKDAGSKIHLSPTDLASPLPAQVEPEQFVNNSFGATESGLGFPRS
jgi:hypothetical protein